eukprot:m.149148 g.149148  ORF g.149148 m.149148 type:complete len:180 (-) comp14225_c0_seq7:1864-2403(-)
MSSRGKTVEGTDGNDFSHRETVKQGYKELVGLKKTVQQGANAIVYLSVICGLFTAANVLGELHRVPCIPPPCYVFICTKFLADKGVNMRDNRVKAMLGYMSLIAAYACCILASVGGALVYEAAEGLGGPPIWLGLLAHTTLVFTIFINVYYTRCIVSIWYVDSLGPTLPRRAAVRLSRV